MLVLFQLSAFPTPTVAPPSTQEPADDLPSNETTQTGDAGGLVARYTVEELAERSYTILIGEVSAVQKNALEEQGVLYKTVTIQVERYVKNPLGQDTVVLKEYASGCLDAGNETVCSNVEDTVPYSTGERVLVFLGQGEIVESQGEALYTLGSVQGKYVLTSDGMAVNADPDRTTPLSDLLEAIEQN